jgi:phosphoribosylglycinamide formyltransferase-1
MGMGEKIRIGALISGGGTNLQAIIDACEDGRIDGEMTFVGSDQPGVKDLSGPATIGIPGFVVELRAVHPILPAEPGTLRACLTISILSEILAKQHLFPADAPEDRVRSFFCTRAAAEHRLLSVKWMPTVRWTCWCWPASCAT